jgi:hypothetical protein
VRRRSSLIWCVTRWTTSCSSGMPRWVGCGWHCARQLVQGADGNQDDLYGWSLGEATRLDRERDAERVSGRPLCPDSMIADFPRGLSKEMP